MDFRALLAGGSFLVLLATHAGDDAPALLPPAIGDVSASESGAPTIDVWYGDEQTFGLRGDPQRWANLLGRAHATGGLSALSYRLNGGPPLPLPWGINTNRLAAGGDYNIELDRDALAPLPDVNTVEIIATSNSGVTERRTVTVRYHAGRLAELPYVVDWKSLDHVDRAHEVATIVDGAWELTSTGIRTSYKGYDRLIAVGDRHWRPEYEARTQVTLHEWRAYGAVGLAIGWQGHTGDAQPRVDWPLEALGWVRNVPDRPEAQVMTFEEGVRERVPYAVSEGITYELKARSELVGGGMARFAFKIWPQGTSEPGWTLVRDVPERSGSVLLVAHHADVTWGPLMIAPLGGNSAPAIVSRPPTQVEVGRVYHYSVEAADPDLTDVLPLRAISLPGFLSLADHEDGRATLSGRAREEDLGWHEVQLEVTDGSLSNWQSFRIEVVPATVRELRSDDFAATSWQPFWRLFAGTGGIELERDAAVFVLGNGAAQPWTGVAVAAPRLLQEIDDEDFFVEVSLEPDEASASSSYGIVVHDKNHRILHVGSAPDSEGPRLVARWIDGDEQRMFAERRPEADQTFPRHFRLQRVGDYWRASCSSTGAPWSELATFSATLEVSEVGAFAARDEVTEKRHVVRLDHFLTWHDTSATEAFNRPPSFFGEPPGTAPPGERYEYTVRAADPDGEPVQLTPLVLPGWLRFQPARDGGRLEGIPGHDDRGAHTVALQLSDARGGRRLQVFDVLVSPGPTVTAITPDDFRGPRPVSSWRLVDPQGDASLVMDGSSLELAVPGGHSHDLWRDDSDAPQIVQKVPDADLSVRTALDEPVEPRYRSQGLLLQSDDGALARCGPVHDGARLQVLLAVLRDGRLEHVAVRPADDPVRHLRLTRIGNALSCEYSADGLSWKRAGIVAHGSRFDAVGLFVGNAGGLAAHHARARFRFFVGHGQVVPR